MYRVICLVLLIAFIFTGCKPTDVKAPHSSIATLEEVDINLINTTLVFTEALKNEDIDKLYGMLSLMYSGNTTKEEFSITVKQLVTSYGRPKGCKKMGVLSGEMQVPESTIPVKIALFKCQFIKIDGSAEPGIMKVTYQMSKTGLSQGVISFVFIPQSNMKLTKIE